MGIILGTMGVCRISTGEWHGLLIRSTYSITRASISPLPSHGIAIAPSLSLTGIPRTSACSKSMRRTWQSCEQAGAASQSEPSLFNNWWKGKRNLSIIATKGHNVAGIFFSFEYSAKQGIPYPSKKQGLTDFLIFSPICLLLVSLLNLHIYQARHWLTYQLMLRDMGKRSRGRLKPQEYRGVKSALNSAGFRQPGSTTTRLWIRFLWSFTLCNQLTKHDEAAASF